MKVVNMGRFAGFLFLAWMAPSMADQQMVPLGNDIRVDVEVSETQVDVATHDQRTLLLDAADLSGITLDVQGGVVTVRAMERRPGRLLLTIHPEIQLNILGADSEIRVEGIHGPVIARNQTQAITIEDIRGPVEAFSYTGRVTIRRVDGKVQAESNTNAVDIRDVTGDVNARSTTSSVSLKNSDSTVVNLQSISGIVSYEGDIPRHGRYQLGTHSGEVHLRVPAESDATILMHGRPKAFTVRGARLDVTDEDVGKIRLGDGRARVVLESLLGAIRVSVRESPAQSPIISPEN